MAEGQRGGLDLIVDVLVLTGIIALVPDKANRGYEILISAIVIIIVAMESKVRHFRLTGYVNEGVNAFRPMYWATALLLLTLFYKPMSGIPIWNDPTFSFVLSTLLVLLAMLLVAYRAAAHNN